MEDFRSLLEDINERQKIKKALSITYAYLPSAGAGAGVLSLRVALHAVSDQGSPAAGA